MRILITGGQGQVAQSLKHHPAALNVETVFLDKTQCDITSASSIQAAFELYQPDVVVNTAAYTAVDLAETHGGDAYIINAAGSLLLAEACALHHTRLIHLSTDYVFDGTTTIPYQETDASHPVNVYGLSKWQGEEAVRTTLDNHLILRVSGVFSEFGKNFLKTILRLAREQDTLRIVGDQFTCPTDAHAIAEAVYRLVNQPNITGTYHFCSQRVISWHEFASLITNGVADSLKMKTLEKIRTDEFPTAAKRPAYAVLNSQKILTDAGIQHPNIETSIQRVLTQLFKETP